MLSTTTTMALPCHPRRRRRRQLVM
jgi:hypothetical protein